MTRNEKPGLSVFKGREAKLNRAILFVLANESSLSIRQVCKRVRSFKDLRYTKYRVVNRRMKALQREGYLELVEVKRIRQGFQAKHYEPTIKFIIALTMKIVDLNPFLQSAEETEMSTLLAALLNFI